mmetsp:Transcript_10839/g.27820  ORF Transcript_10839/g.27820 Transcript_10839/m.27820 type:complete len:187 (+) Transcript_10839:185-745(+)
MENEWKVAREGKKRERCCFCFDLRRGVIRLASAKLAVACLFLLIGIIKLMDGSDIPLINPSPGVFSIFKVIWVVLCLPFAAMGLYGASSQHEKFVYAYFVYAATMAALSAIALSVIIIKVATGALNLETLPISIPMIIISGGLQSYFAYVIRRLYLQIVMEKTRESLLPCYKPPQRTEAIAESITF